MTNSSLEWLTEPDDFVVACGEEGSDPLVLHDGHEVRVDEFAASGHLDRQDRDLADVADLGVRWWRYGMPWRLTETAPGEYDWSLWDAALRACEVTGLTPVVDLCHFGLPDHYPGFLDSAWVEGFERYVAAFLDRYSEPLFFTPVNEPMITASTAALLGFWNDRVADRHAYYRALANVTLANLTAVEQVRADRDGWWLGAEGFGCHLVADDDHRAAADDARALEQLTWDLHFGVEPREQVADVAEVVDPSILSRIDTLAGTATKVIAGHDFYPVSVALHGFGPDHALSVEDRIAAYDAEARAWYQRYRREFWVAETSNLGLDVEQGELWLERLVDCLDTMRADGLPERGICWYSRGDQYDWDVMLLAPVGQVTEVGLFDAARRPRPVADAYARLARLHSR